MFPTLRLVSFSVAILAIAVGPLHGQEPAPRGLTSSLPLPLHVFCGESKDPYVSSEGTVYLADRAYGEGPSPHWGFIGGSTWVNHVPASGTKDPFLFEQRRYGFFDYRIDLPPGLYAVRLHFSEWIHHAPDQNVFAIEMEGEIREESLDLFAEVGKDYAYSRVFAVEVRDSALDIGIIPSQRGVIRSLTGTLAAFSIQPLIDDGSAPETPRGLSVRGSYARMIVSWEDSRPEDIDGYHIYRRPLQGDWQRVNARPIRVSRFLDEDVSPGARFEYAVTALDLWKRESAPSPPVGSRVLEDREDPLSIFELDIAPFDLRRLQGDVFDRRTAVARLHHGGKTYDDVEVRYRGFASRFSAKKSWRLSFKGEDLFDDAFRDRDVVNLVSTGTDPSLLKEFLCSSLYAELGLPSPRAMFLRLSINGVDQGLYVDVERVDERFLERIGRDPQGALYKASEFADLRVTTLESYQSSYERKGNSTASYDDLIYFIESLNTLSDDAFVRGIHALLDVGAFLDYYAALILTSRGEFVAQNYYLYRDPSTSLWHLLPWDNDVSFGSTRFGRNYDYHSPIDRGTAQSSPDGDNPLFTRMMSVPEFRSALAGRLDEAIDGPFAPEALKSRVRLASWRIRFDARRDLLKIGSEDDAPHLRALALLEHYAQFRGAYLKSQIPTFAPDSLPAVRLNEVRPPHDDGDASAWIELVHYGADPQPLNGFRLVTPENEFTIPNDTVAPGALASYTVGLLLSHEGGDVQLLDAQDHVLDSVSYPPLDSESTIQRQPDAKGPWISGVPSPGLANQNLDRPPSLSGTCHHPASPSPGEPVSLVSVVHDGSGVREVIAHVEFAGQMVSHPMYDDGRHGDGNASDRVYGTVLDGFPDGITVHYWIEAIDRIGLSSRDPARVPWERHQFRVGSPLPSVLINELQADNESTYADEFGEFDDWFELFNDADDSVDLGGFYLTDDLQEPTKWQIPEGVFIDPGDWLLFWADGEPHQGPMHTSFKLSKDGEEIHFFDRDGQTRLDSIVFGPQLEDESLGRIPDAGPSWEKTAVPTPGGANRGE